jgi:hypothetical protein
MERPKTIIVVAIVRFWSLFILGGDKLWNLRISREKSTLEN